VDSKNYVRHPGTGTFHGREVIWIGRRQTGGFAPYSIHFGEWVALDAQTHQPVATRTYVDEGQLMAEQRVVKRLPDVDQNSFWFVVPDTRPTG
jgi:hypothetical protein